MQMPGRNANPGKYRYGFNGMENDNEVKGNGNSLDFGARIYDSRLGRWMSTDPLQEDYPALSPYNFVANNPINYVDPDGRKIWIVVEEEDESGECKLRLLLYKNDKLVDSKDGSEYSGDDDYANTVLNDLNSLKNDDDENKERIETLEKSDKNHFITMPDKLGDGNSHSASSSNAINGIPTNSKVKYDPYNEKTVSGDERTPRIGLAHELLGHSYDSDQGTHSQEETENGIKSREVDAVNIENKTRAALGEKKRTSYGNKEIPEDCLDDTHDNCE